MLPLSAQQVAHHTVYFDFDQFELNAQGRETLDHLATQLEGLPDYSIEIQAHTDVRGRDAYNDGLARQRAQTVLELLTERGIPVEKTTVQSFGESLPVYGSEDEQSHQLNRRVDVMVTSWTYDSVDDLFGRLLDDPLQVYEIDPGRSVRLTGEKGTTVWIPAKSFVFEDGTSPRERVTLHLREAYERPEMILQGLHTTAGNQLLETGGMFYLSAQAGDRPLELQAGAQLTVAMPTAEQQEGMELFRGVSGPDGRLEDWEASGQPFSSKLEDLLDLPPRPRMPYNVFVEPGFRLDKSGEPAAPGKPRSPYEPHEPRRESFKYRPGFFQRVFISKEKVKAIEERRYQKALEAYKRKKDRYREALLVYEQALQQYELELDAFQKNYAAWEKSLEQQRTNWKQSPAYIRAQELNRQRNEQLEAAWQDSLAAWEAMREEKLRTFEKQYESVGRLNNRTLDRYFFRVNTLGWINCDRFRDVPEEQKMPLAVRSSGKDGERIFIVFESLNSIVEMQWTEEYYTSSPLPGNEQVRIIGFRVKDGKAQLAVRKMMVAEGGKEPLKLDFENCRLGDLRSVLSEI